MQTSMNVNVPLEYLKNQFQHTFCSSRRTLPKILKWYAANYWPWNVRIGHLRFANRLNKTSIVTFLT